MRRGALVCDAQDHRPAALVGERNAILDQLLEVVAVFRLFELQMLVFPSIEPGL